MKLFVRKNNFCLEKVCFNVLGMKVSNLFELKLVNLAAKAAAIGVSAAICC